MTERGSILTVALPTDQRGDAIRVPVEIRYVLSASGKAAPDSPESNTWPWRTAPGPHRFLAALSLLKALLDAPVCGTTIMYLTAYDGVPMWQFLYEPMWHRLYFATDLVDALIGILDDNDISELRICPAQGPAAEVWESVARRAGESRGLPVCVLPAKWAGLWGATFARP